MAQPEGQPTTNVPGVGPVKRQWLFVGAAVVAVIVGYAYYKRRNRSGPSTVYDPATGTPAADLGGYQNPAPTSPPSGVVDDPNVISNNDEWSRVAVDRLVSAGWNAQYAATVIGKYLAGQQLTTEEADLIRAAYALAGYPPQMIAIVTAPPPPVEDDTPPDTNPPPPPNTNVPPTKPARRYVIVVRFTSPNPDWRSTLSGIAAHTGRSVGELAAWNGIPNPDLIYPNQQIFVDPPGDYSGETQIG